MWTWSPITVPGHGPSAVPVQPMPMQYTGEHLPPAEPSCATLRIAGRDGRSTVSPMTSTDRRGVGSAARMPQRSNAAPSEQAGITDRMRERGRPVWLLDFDGVINLVSGAPRRALWPAGSWVTLSVDVDGDPVTVTAALPVLEFLRAVHDAGAVDIRWHSTWQESAPAELTPALGLPSWPVADAPEYTDPDSGAPGVPWWKLPAAQRVLADEQRPLIWTDDELAVQLPSSDLGGGADFCCVSPRDYHGLTPHDITRIDTFIRAHPSGS